MFSIYSMAVVSLDDAQCLSIFGHEKQVLLAKYQSAVQQALVNAGFLRSSDLVVLQALPLYLVSDQRTLTPCIAETEIDTMQISIRQKFDPGSLYLVVGLAVRSAQRMGLHLDTTATTNRLPPFHIEMCRRCWWRICILDSRLAELGGTGTSILNGKNWQTPLPLNLDDSDIYPSMKTMPPSRSTTTKGRTTEMVFGWLYLCSF